MALNAAQNALIGTIEIHRDSGAITRDQASELVAQVEHGDFQTAAANLNSLIGTSTGSVFASRGLQAFHADDAGQILALKPQVRQANDLFAHVDCQDDALLAAGEVPEDRSSAFVTPFLVS